MSKITERIFVKAIQANNTKILKYEKKIEQLKKEIENLKKGLEQAKEKEEGDE